MCGDGYYYICKKIYIEREMEEGLSWGIGGLTVASQHTRTSYRWPGFRFSRKNHESVPSGAAVVGNEALR